MISNESSKLSAIPVITAITADYKIDLDGLVSEDKKLLKDCLDVNMMYGSLMASYGVYRKDNSEEGWGRISGKKLSLIMSRVSLKVDGYWGPWANNPNYIPCCGDIPKNKEIILPSSFWYEGQMKGPGAVFNMKLQGIIENQGTEDFIISDKELKYLTSQYLYNAASAMGIGTQHNMLNSNLKKGYFISLGGNRYRISQENEHLYKYLLPNVKPVDKPNFQPKASPTIYNCKTTGLPFMDRVKILFGVQV